MFIRDTWFEYASSRTGALSEIPRTFHDLLPTSASRHPATTLLKLDRRTTTPCSTRTPPSSSSPTLFKALHILTPIHLHLEHYDQCVADFKLPIQDSIPGDADAKDYYEILGVARDGSRLEVRKRYKRENLKHHPDKCISRAGKEEARDLADLSQLARRANRSTASPLSQGSAHRNSQYPQLKFSLFHASHHPFRGTDPAKYRVKAEPAVLQNEEGLPAGETLAQIVLLGDEDNLLDSRAAYALSQIARWVHGAKAMLDAKALVHYADVNMSSRTPASKAAASQASNIFSSHYPELLFKKFFVNVPGYMSWLFWIFKTILPAATFAKMSVVGSSPRSIGKALLPFIAPEELPKRYGGTASAEVFEKK
ncbi:hypothetical protein DFH08DRAFT_955102 [Mycena albidolilacea]|uniref:Phosphatidylinositol transfer protein SFH5 n=1 Tax=Mycena albidolilacea TaxID=1033008 RepID=A0AAD7EZ50_9AGAR|nr:hypothetical protein DFH08DRAFT_955102 [Mycena albidolilacea]